MLKFLPIAVLVMAGCGTGQGISDADMDAIRSEIRDEINAQALVPASELEEELKKYTLVDDHVDLMKKRMDDSKLNESLSLFVQKNQADLRSVQERQVGILERQQKLRKELSGSK